MTVASPRPGASARAPSRAPRPATPSASLGAYAAQRRAPGARVRARGQVALGKLAQTLAYGARTLLVRGDFDDCLRAGARGERASSASTSLNSINPWRLEGQKTIVFELLQQLDWDAPDWIALPAGNLGNTAAFGKALREAHALGLIDRRAAPRGRAGGGRGAVRR